MRPSLLIFALALLATPSVAIPQDSSGKMIGVVNGTENKPAPGVHIHITREGRPKFSADSTTDKLGDFSFVGLLPGFYELEFNSGEGLPCRVSHLEIGSVGVLDLTIAISSARDRSPCLDPLVREVSWGTEFSQFSKDKLPNTGNIWSILESQEPSTVTDRLDVGGLRTGVPALFGARGASWTENQYILNGLDITDPYIPGRPLSDPELDSVNQLKVSASGKPALSAGSGEALVLTTAMPFEEFHGAARVFYSARGLQADNVDASLRRLGAPGPERLDYLADGPFELGGALPLRAAHWPVFGSFSTQLLSKNLGGFALPIDVHVYRSLAELTPLSRDLQKLDLLFGSQHVFDSREGAAPRVAPSATTRGMDDFYQSQVRWHRVLSPSSIFGLGFGAVHAVVSSGLQPGLLGASSFDMPLVTRTGPAQLSSAGIRSRYQANTYWGVERSGLAGNHSVDLGLNWDRSTFSNRWDSMSGMEQILVNGSGAEVVQWNTPAEARGHIQNLALFAQDAWRPAAWLRIPMGLRLETSTGRATGVQQAIRWTTLEPRAGMILPLTRRGLILRANWSRYGHLLQGRYLDDGTPASLSGQIFRWQDLDLDGIAQPSEITQRLEVFGGRYSALDRGLTRPYTDEFSASIEKYFAGNFRVVLKIFRRDDHRLIGLSNIGVPLSGYTPVKIVDPGNDGILGTADDQILTLYNRIPSWLGRDFLLLANVPGDRASCKAFELQLIRPLVRSWEFSASFTGMRTLAPTSPGNSVFENDTGFVGSLYTDPNTLLFDTSRTYFDRGFIGKATTFYVAPAGFHISAVAKYYDGLPFGRMLFVNGFNQGPFFVRATPRSHPGAFQTQFNGTLDLRVARDFALRRGKISSYLDFFNALNMNRKTLEVDLTGPQFQSRVPLAFEPPRIARLGVEWNF